MSGKIKKILRDDLLPSAGAGVLGAVIGVIGGPVGSVVGGLIGGAIPPAYKAIKEQLDRKNLTILILEDDEPQLQQHLYYFENIGHFKCVGTQYGQKAIDEVDNDKYQRIKFGIFDEILLDQSSQYQEKPLQPVQGLDAIRSIHNERPDIKFIFVTSKPKDKGDGDWDKILEEIEKLQIPGVVLDVIHKDQIKKRSGKTYNYMCELIRKNR